jgi:hypothetical protein
VDVGYQLIAAEAARKLTDVDEAHRLLQLRGRELFVELSAREWTLTALQWAAIDDWYIEGDAATPNVSRPPVRACRPGDRGPDARGRAVETGRTGSWAVTTGFERRNSVPFIAHLTELCRRLRQWKVIQICDNASFHTSQVVRKRSDRVVFHYLPT